MSRRVLTFGEALIDCFPDRRVVAGAPLHVAVHLARAGWNAAFVSRVGDDQDGRWIRETLAERGVDTALVATDPELPTGTVTIELDEDGLGHGFTIHRPAAWDAIVAPPSWPPHDALVFGTLGARAETSRGTLLSLLGEPCELRVFDVNLRPPDVRRDVLELGLSRAHVVKTNDEEFEEVGSLLGLSSPRDWFDAVGQLRWLCVTRGADGAALHGRDGAVHEVPGADADVVDTVGAGDAFTAGLVDALGRGLDARQALEQASGFSAEVLTSRGGLPPA